MTDSPSTWTFGHLEYVFASIHSIANTKRTAFQARLKNFNKLGIPHGLMPQKGKTRRFSVGEVVELSIALELTQLGLSPDRVAWILGANWFSVTSAVRMAARSLVDHPAGYTERGDHDPLAMFLVFDPSSLNSLTVDPRASGNAGFGPDQADETFVYAGEGIVRENVVRWTSGFFPRLSLVNVTGMLDLLSFGADPTGQGSNTDQRKQFFTEVFNWSSRVHDEYLSGEGLAPRYLLWNIFRFFVSPKQGKGNIDDQVIKYASMTGFEETIIRSSLEGYLSDKDPSEWQ